MCWFGTVQIIKRVGWVGLTTHLYTNKIGSCLKLLANKKRLNEIGGALAGKEPSSEALTCLEGLESKAAVVVQTIFFRCEVI